MVSNTSDLYAKPTVPAVRMPKHYLRTIESNPITDSDFFMPHACKVMNISTSIHFDGGKLFNLDRIIINSPPLVQGAGDAFFSKRMDQAI